MRTIFVATVFFLFFGFLQAQKQDNKIFGFLAWEQRNPWAGYVGLYFSDADNSGWLAQAQFINQPQVWMLGGRYYQLKGLFIEFNTGPVVYKDQMKISNWCF